VCRRAARERGTGRIDQRDRSAAEFGCNSGNPFRYPLDRMIDNRSEFDSGKANPPFAPVEYSEVEEILSDVYSRDGSGWADVISGDFSWV